LGIKRTESQPVTKVLLQPGLDIKNIAVVQYQQQFQQTNKYRLFVFIFGFSFSPEGPGRLTFRRTFIATTL